MKTISSLFFILISFNYFSQLEVQIIDIEDSKPLPFSKIIPNTGSPILSDLDGYFSIDTIIVSEIKISSFGYFDTILKITSIQNNKISLRPHSTSIEEVKIIPGENPAHRIMNQVIERRKINSPTANDAFKYNSYSKFVFDINEEAIASISDTSSNNSLLDLKKYFEKQHLLLLESATKRTFIPPTRDKEEITAYKVSGFSDPMLSSFANEMQSFSFYENQFEMFGKTYINPIAFGGTKRYLFLMEDTTVINQDTTFTISFRPRKDKNFDGLKGYLYINTNGFAVEKVIVEPIDSIAGARIKVVQEYEFIEQRKWFPSKLSTEIKFPALLINDLKNGYIEGKGNMYIKDVVLNPEGLKKITLNNVALVTADDANDKTESDWDSLRVYKISEKEKNTYRKLDSISKENHLDYKLKALSSLIQGKIPMGYLNIDLTRLLDYKLFEGYRIGLGIETSFKTMKKATVGGYFGWGSKDQKWKYGGFAEIRLNKDHSIKMNLKYQQDLIERGGFEFQKESFNLNSGLNYAHIYIKNMEYQRLAQATISGYISSNFKLVLGGNYQRIWYSGNYEYSHSISTFSNYQAPFDIAETFSEINWNIREKVIQLGENRMGKGTKYPKISIKIAKGWKNWEESKYDYLRINASITQEVSIKTVGKIYWLMNYGKTIRDVPLYLQQVATGSGGNWNLSVRNSFETMLPFTYYSKEHINLFTRFTFRSFKSKVSFFKPQMGIHNAIGYGYFNNQFEHSVSFSTLSKGYFESGIIIDGILVSGFSKIGMGVFYKYGKDTSPYVKDNLMYKISLALQL